MADGRWPMADGRWPMADGRWPMADGRWPMADGRWPIDVSALQDRFYRLIWNKLDSNYFKTYYLLSMTFGQRPTAIEHQRGPSFNCKL
jgi:hypothetical protein